MATNFVQLGNTIPITNADTDDIASGDPVVVGDLVAVAITDIAPGITGDGLTEGVFLLPKLAADAIGAGEKVYLKAGKIQVAATDAVFAGFAWEAAEASSTVVAVKING